MQPQYDKVPQCVRGPIERYIEQGLDPGSGLRMVLSHDLMAVCACDDETVAVLPQVMRWLHCEAPSGCHGSHGQVTLWMALDGLSGRQAA